MRISGDYHPDPDAHRIVADLLLPWVIGGKLVGS
jgi:hypothetical protein